MHVNKIILQWEVQNKESVADLLVGFFEYYADFDWQQVVSVRLGKAVELNHEDLLKARGSKLIIFIN